MSTALMTTFRPYLVKALLSWINDNEMTPHVLVDATAPGVQVPPYAIKDGKILLNVSLNATRNLQVEDEFLAFSARFGGMPFDVLLPIASLMAVFAQETGMGMGLAVDPAHGVRAPSNTPSPPSTSPATPAPTPAPAPDKAARRAHLKVVK